MIRLPETVAELTELQKRVEAALQEAIERTPVPVDPDRCAVCGWTFAAAAAPGCSPAQCSYVTHDERGRQKMASAREQAEARAKLSAADSELLDEDMARAGIVSVPEAWEILDRFNASHWHPRGTRAPEGVERARYSIPANPKRDDDIRLGAFIWRAHDLQNAVHELLKSADDSRDRWEVSLAAAVVRALLKGGTIQKCEACDGTGAVPSEMGDGDDRCPDCNGSGEVVRDVDGDTFPAHPPATPDEPGA